MFLEVFIFPIYLKRHLRIFGQNIRVSPPSMVLCALVNFLNHFPNALLEVRCFKNRSFQFKLFFWTFQIRKRRLGKTILGTEVVKIWINFFHFFKNILLKLFYLIQLEMMFFCQKFLLLVHSYFVKHL